MSIQKLREERSAYAKEYRHILDQNQNKLTAEETKRLDELMDNIAAVEDRIAREEKILAIEAEKIVNVQVAESIGKKTGGDSVAQKLLNKWLKGGDKALTAQDWQHIQNTMSTTTSSEGGYTVQADVARRVVDALKAYGGVRQVATVIQTAGFGDLNFPTSDGTAETGEQIAQNTTATVADPAFGVKTVTAYKYSSKIVAVPFELLQDTNIDVEQFVMNRLITRIGRITNTKFTVGTGSSEPMGIVTAAASGKVGTSGQTLIVIFDDLIDLIHSVDPAYRALQRCEFMMNDQSLRNIRKIKDGNGRPIFLPGYDGMDTGRKMNDSILGYPVNTNQDVAVMAANAKSILFGDYSYYVVRDVMGAQLFRFDDSAYIKLGQIGFLMWMRCGGNFTDVGGAVKYYQNSAT